MTRRVAATPRSLVLVLLALGLAFGCGAPSGPETAATDAADTIYRGGPIVTVDDDNPSAEALAVRDGVIVAVGSEYEVMTLRGDDTEVVDLAGRTLTPGFVDGHAHVLNFGMQAVGANLLAPPDGTVESIDDLVEKLKAFAEGPDVGRTGWIFGTGYDDSVLAEGRHPTRDELDRVSTEVGVLALHISGHFCTVNSKGLELFGITAQTEDPEGGIIRRRPGTREPNGVLEELAAIPNMVQALSPATNEDADYFLEKGLEMAKSFGYTTAQEGRAFAGSHDSMVRSAEAGDFDIDVVSYIDYTSKDLLASEWHTRDYRNHYRIGGLKITLDGSPQGRTAWRTQPYLIPPDGQNEDYAGYPAIPDTSVVHGLFDEGYEKGWQILTHANGDAAMDQLIAAVRPVHEEYGPGDRRNVLIHGQYIRPDQLDALVELQIMPSLFPMHTFYWGDWHAQIIGEELAQKISPMRSALDRGLIPTSHTDAPVALPNLMQVMWATVNRVTRSGRVLGPEERLTPIEALKAVTLWGAYQHFEEDRKGSLEVGKVADLVILSDNPLTIEPMEINSIEVMETVKDGKTVWKR